MNVIRSDLKQVYFLRFTFIHSTASNCPAPVAPPAPANNVTEDKTAEQDQGAAQEAAQPDK